MLMLERGGFSLKELKQQKLPATSRVLFYGWGMSEKFQCVLDKVQREVRV